MYEWFKDLTTPICKLFILALSCRFLKSRYEYFQQREGHMEELKLGRHYSKELIRMAEYYGIH